MARRIREQFPGAVYHVMARGNERQPIFRDDKDRKRFCEVLGEAVQRFGLRVYAYCLMPVAARRTVVRRQEVAFGAHADFAPPVRLRF